MIYWHRLHKLLQRIQSLQLILYPYNRLKLLFNLRLTEAPAPFYVNLRRRKRRKKSQSKIVLSKVAQVHYHPNLLRKKEREL